MTKDTIVSTIQKYCAHEINNIFTQIVLLLANLGFIILDMEYIDGLS